MLKSQSAQALAETRRRRSSVINLSIAATAFVRSIERSAGRLAAVSRRLIAAFTSVSLSRRSPSLSAASIKVTAATVNDAHSAKLRLGLRKSGLNPVCFPSNCSRIDSARRSMNGQSSGALSPRPVTECVTALLVRPESCSAFSADARIGLRNSRRP